MLVMLARYMFSEPLTEDSLSNNLSRRYGCGSFGLIRG